jgi:putative flippase GtrA
MVSRRLVRFIVVGGIGFLVDAGVLTLAVRHLYASVYEARALSFTMAVLATWLLNRTFVFATGEDASPILAEYGRYFTTQVIGALSNLLVFAALIEAFPRLASTPVVPLAVGAVLGALVNYAGSAWWVFRPKRRSNP